MGGIKFLSKKDDKKKLEKKKCGYCSYILYVKKEEVYRAFVSKYYSNFE